MDLEMEEMANSMATTVMKGKKRRRDLCPIVQNIGGKEGNAARRCASYFS